MKKRYIIILSIAITIILGVIVGIWLSNRNRTSNLEPETKSKLAVEENIQNEIQIIQTANTQIKTSPNCLFIFETYYKECEHITNEKIDIPKQDVNKTEEDLQEKYKDYMIKEFTANEVTFYQEKEGICKEHYVIRDNNGYVAIYTIDSFGQEILKETTEIVTTYLPEADKMELKKGIKAIGQEELNAHIEDYE